MNPNEIITVDIESDGFTNEMRQIMEMIHKEMAVPVEWMMPQFGIDASSISDGAIYAVVSAMADTEDEKSSGPISEINIANIL